MMHGSATPRAATLVRRFAHIDDPRGIAKAVARPFAFVRNQLKAQDTSQELDRGRSLSLPDLRAVQAADLMLARDRSAFPRLERTRRHKSRFNQRHVQTMRIDQLQDRVAESL